MKSLILKTLLVISAVTLTSMMLAWAQAQEPASAVSDKRKPASETGCNSWDKDKLCDPTDTNLKGAGKPIGATEGESTECKYPDQRCFRRKNASRMKDTTAAPVKTEKPVSPNTGNASPTGKPGTK